jgi:hypothetical protein
VLGAVAAVAVVLASPGAGATLVVPAQVGGLAALLASSASDPRATFHSGNAVTCGQEGFASSIQVGAQGNNTATDGTVTGTPGPNTGTIQPGKGEELNVTINGNPVIDAVVVKGGNGYNVYSNPAVLPPTLASPQHYISPFNGGGNVPTLSHWFICYHPGTPPPLGALVVTKIVIQPDFPPTTPLPTQYTATATCDGVAHPITFGAGGGQSAPITGITPGTTCVVTEDPVTPAPTTVTFNPATANTTGVVIVASAVVVVAITNDYSGLQPEAGNLRVVKALVAPPTGVTVPATFTATVMCDDGTNTNVTLPGTGGEGSPSPIPVAANALCAVGEDNSALPAGWVISYSVDGGAPTSTPAVFNVSTAQTVTVTITNDPTAVAPTTIAPTTAPTSPTTTPVAPTSEPTLPGTLPPTGATRGGTTVLLIGGLSFALAGLILIVAVTRRRAPADRT